uniref:Uncharacterized protein n=1 Tax=Arundo donax TaxID=35708 RepID=A0A0A9CBH0_ARUDO
MIWMCTELFDFIIMHIKNLTMGRNPTDFVLREGVL